MTESLRKTGLSRRGCITAGGALLAALPMLGRSSALAAVPAFDSSFKDFAVSSYDADDSLSRVQKKGELVIGTSNDWPYSFLDPKTGEFDGIDADIIKMVTKVLKISKITVQTVPFDGLVAGVSSGRFDMVGDSIHYTPKRAQVVGFSYPTYFYADGLVVKKGSAIEATGLSDLKGKSVGTILGTNYTDWIQEEPSITYKGYKDAQSLVQDVASGRLDVGIYDQPVLAAVLKENSQWSIEFVPAYKPRTPKVPANYSCYLFRQADEQLNAGVSRVVQWMQQSGEMRKIITKWNLGADAE